VSISNRLAQRAHPGQVVPRPGDALDEASFHRVAGGPEHHWDAGTTRGLLGHRGPQVRRREDQVHFLLDEFPGKLPQQLPIQFGVPDVVRDVLPVSVAKVLQAIPETFHRGKVGIVRNHHPNLIDSVQVSVPGGQTHARHEE
jgi:hypothetical protein